MDKIFNFTAMDSENTFINCALAMRGEREVHFDVADVKERMATLPHSVALTCMTNLLAGNQGASDWNDAAAQMKIIASEFKELTEAVETRNPRLLRDGIGDLLYTVIGLAYRTGVPLAEDLDQVVQSNLTKFDVSASDAYMTKVKYEAIGIRTYVDQVKLHVTGLTASPGQATYSYFVTRVDGDQVDASGKDYPNGKWLKSTKFVDIQLEPLSPDSRIELLARERFDIAASTVMRGLLTKANARFAFKSALAFGFAQAIEREIAAWGEFRYTQYVAEWAVHAAQLLFERFVASSKANADYEVTHRSDLDDGENKAVLELVRTLPGAALILLEDPVEQAAYIQKNAANLLEHAGLYDALRVMGDNIAADKDLQVSYYSNLAMAAFDAVKPGTQDDNSRYYEQRRSIANAASDFIMPIVFTPNAPLYFDVFPEHRLSAE